MFLKITLFLLCLHFSSSSSNANKKTTTEFQSRDYWSRHTTHVRWRTRKYGWWQGHVDKNANKRAAFGNMIQDLIWENQQKIDMLEDIRINNMDALAFEVGFICAAVQDKMRRMLDLYQFSTDAGSHLYRYEHSIMLQECEHHYWEIEHMVNMLYEIERKEGIKGDFEPNYADTFADLMLMRNVTTTTRWRVTITSALRPLSYRMQQKKERKIIKNIKLGVLKGTGDGAYFFLKRNTRKTTPKNWAKNYGWDIDYYW